MAQQPWGSLPVHKGGVCSRLQPSPAVSGRLQPSPAVSSLKGASGFPLTIVNWPFVNCQLSIGFESIVNCYLDWSQLGSKSDPLVFHWQSIGNPLASQWQLAIGTWQLQLAAWLPGWGLETGGWGLVAGDWWLEACGQGLGWLVGWGWASWLDACLLAWLAGSWRLVAGDWPGW